MTGDEINKNFMCSADAPRYRLENLIKTKSDASDKLIQNTPGKILFFSFRFHRNNIVVIPLN